MEDNKQVETRKAVKAGRGTLIAGILITLFACMALIGSVMLDVVGEKAVGKLSNVSTGCSAGKTCWTGKMEFTAQNGEEISFYPTTFPMLFDFDPVLSGRPYEEYGNYQVRYLQNFPQLAKVKLAFYLEYTNLGCALGIGLIVLLIGYLSSRPNKPIVIDLSKRKQQNDQKIT
jgi:hypothetical protein